MGDQVIEVQPDWGLIEATAGEDTGNALRQILGAIGELVNQARRDRVETFLPRDVSTSSSIHSFKTPTGQTLVQVGNLFVSSGWDGIGPGIIFHDPDNAFRASWAIFAGTGDSVSGARDALRIVDIVNDSEVFQVTRTGSGVYAIHPFRTEAGSTITAVDLGVNGTYTKFRDLWLSGTVHAAAVDAPVSGVVPVGTVLEYAGSSLPTDYLWADGTSYTTSAKATLFAAIGYTWGGAGANFNVPDRRDKQAIGKGTTYNTLGAAVGAATHTHTNPSTGSGGGHTPTGTGVTAGDNLGPVDVDISAGAISVAFGGDANVAAASTFPTDNIVVDAEAVTLTMDAVSGHTHTVGDTGSANHLFSSVVCNYIIRYQ